MEINEARERASIAIAGKKLIFGSGGFMRPDVITPL